MKYTKRKKYSKYVYACPICWKRLAVGKKPDIPIVCCAISHDPKSLIVFDSIIEQEKGWELKTMEKAGVIQDLKHHEKFSLIPTIFYGEWDFPKNYSIGIPLGECRYLTILKRNYLKNEFKIHDEIYYESDFSFTQGEEKRVIEIKDLGKKKIKKKILVPTKTIVQSYSHTEKEYMVKQSIPWPFLTGKTLVQLKKKFKLMKTIYGIDIDIWAGTRVFRFNEKWKLMEAAK